MYRVLIVDDEVLVRVGLKTTIDWESMGFTIVGEATNGEQGYEKYQSLSPDVVFSDIKMPKKDGIWLVNEIRKNDQQTKVLMLTCYDDFSYVRQVLKAGADDYILKTEIEDEDLAELMKKLKDQLDANSDARHRRVHAEKNMKAMKRAVMNDLIQARFRIDKKLMEQCKNCDFNLEYARYGFASLKSSKPWLENDASPYDLKAVLLNTLEDQFNKFQIDYMYQTQEDQIHLVICTHNEMIHDFRKVFERVQTALEQYFDMTSHVIYSMSFKDLSEMFKHYQAFMKARELLFYDQEDVSLLQDASTTAFSEQGFLELKDRYTNAFIEALGNQNSDVLGRLIDESSEKCSRDQIKPSAVRMFYANLVNESIQFLQKVMDASFDWRVYEGYSHRVSRANGLLQIKAEMRTFISVADELMTSCKGKQGQMIAQRALNYIESNYASQISLDDVARELNVSKHYLSHLFSKTFDENMSTCINRYRIEKAKILLLNSGVKVKDIYDKVGFSSPYYFSRVFKKVTGMSVMDYKNRASQK